MSQTSELGKLVAECSCLAARAATFCSITSALYTSYRQHKLTMYDSSRLRFFVDMPACKFISLAIAIAAALDGSCCVSDPSSSSTTR